MPKKHPHPVTLQFSVQYAIPKNRRFKMTKEIINQAIEYWIENGDDPPGFVITPIAWVHDDNVTEADDSDQFRVMLGRLLQSGASLSFTVRNDEML